MSVPEYTLVPLSSLCLVSVLFYLRDLELDPEALRLVYISILFFGYLMVLPPTMERSVLRELVKRFDTKIHT